MSIFIDDHLTWMAFLTLGLLSLLLRLLNKHIPVEQLELLFGGLSFTFILAFLGLT